MQLLGPISTNLVTFKGHLDPFKRYRYPFIRKYSYNQALKFESTGDFYLKTAMTYSHVVTNNFTQGSAPHIQFSFSLVAL